MSAFHRWKDLGIAVALISLLVAFVVANLKGTGDAEGPFNQNMRFFTCASFADIDGDGIADIKGQSGVFTTNESISVVGYVVGQDTLSYTVSNSQGAVIVRNSRPNRGFGLTHVFHPGQLPPDGYLVNWMDGQGFRVGRSTFIVTPEPPTVTTKNPSPSSPLDGRPPSTVESNANGPPNPN